MEAVESLLVLLVDDDADMRLLVSRWLTSEGFRVDVAEDAKGFFEAMQDREPHVVCIDLGLPDMSGLEVLERLRARWPDTPAVVLTGDREVASVVEAMRLGATDYVTKPTQRAVLMEAIQKAMKRRVSAVPAPSHRVTDTSEGFSRIVGRSEPMRTLYRQLERIAPNDVTVMITGETGTGKELVAEAIHEHSTRRSGKLIAVNCAAIPESLQDSELFGHEKGAFTGAVATKLGTFERAEGGTLFLDEVGELALPTQAKLLRVLQERKLERVGGTRTISVDFRLIVATHRNLEAMVLERTFRQDLFFRLAVMEIELPPLRARRGDLEPLTQALLKRISDEDRRPAPRISESAMASLTSYSWPGNVRELDNVLRRAVVLCQTDEIQREDLPDRILAAVSGAAAAAGAAKAPPNLHPGAEEMTLEELERWALKTMMERTNHNIPEVARRLQIGRTTAYRKLKEYGILGKNVPEGEG